MILESKSTKLFIILSGFFITNALVAEFIGVKIFAFEDTFGLEPFNWNLFGQKGSLQFSAGVILWPVVFIFTDIINEYFGKKGVQFLSYLTVFLISFAFLIIFLAIQLVPADWWVAIGTDQGTSNMQAAFSSVFGQSMWIIVGSLVAFLVGQVVDVIVFQKIKRKFGEGKIWLRATVSTLVSQFIDSFIVLYIAFVLGPQQWGINKFLAIGTVNYTYKFLMAFLMIPFLYLVHFGIERYLGRTEANALRKTALGTMN